MSITIVIAEDQRLFRQSLRLLLEHERDLVVVGEAMDGRQAFDLAMAHKPGIVLMDVDMPRLDGITATRLIRSCVPDSKVLMLSVHDDYARIVAAVQAGASGYILKDADHQEFLRIIRATFEGEPVRSRFMPDGFAKKAVALVNKQDESNGSGLSLLTDRERKSSRQRRGCSSPISGHPPSHYSVFLIPASGFLMSWANIEANWLNDASRSDRTNCRSSACCSVRSRSWSMIDSRRPAFFTGTSAV